MKKIIPAICAIVLFLCACGQKAPTWQEQYDLGVRYLSEGNYEEAIIAFTAAIEIEPKNADAYIGLADVYIQQGEYDKAYTILEDGFNQAEENKAIVNMMKNWQNGIYTQLNTYGSTEFKTRRYYVDFQSFNDSEKTFIQTVANAAIAEDSEALKEMVGFLLEYDYSPDGIYTIFDNYKLQISTLESRLTIEMRPENGMGYYYDILDWSDAGGGTIKEIHTEVITCPCIDWQWNGQMEDVHTQYEQGYTYKIGSQTPTGTYTMIYTTEMSGMMTNSLRTGVYTFHTDVFEDDSDGDQYYETGDVEITTYQDGKQGEAIYSIDPIGYGGTMEDIWLLDKLYW